MNDRVIYLKFYSSKEGMITDFWTNGEMWKLYCEMGLLVLELGQKEYKVVLPWMIADFLNDAENKLKPYYYIEL